jgi:hypothetical protein
MQCLVERRLGTLHTSVASGNNRGRRWTTEAATVEKAMKHTSVDDMRRRLVSTLHTLRMTSTHHTAACWCARVSATYATIGTSRGTRRPHFSWNNTLLVSYHTTKHTLHWSLYDPGMPLEGQSLTHDANDEETSYLERPLHQAMRKQTTSNCRATTVKRSSDSSN